MTIVVPAVLGGLAITVMALVSIGASRRSRRQAALRQGPAQVRVLIHSINDDRCTGCDACVAVCPTNVLDLVDNKSRVLRFEDCIQCEACMWACPTTALVMHPEGTQPPTYRLPDVDDNYQTAVPGQYLIGEVAGKPLVKNAANMGRAVVEHMLTTGLRPMQQHGASFDVAIVGSGPGGLSAALTCIKNGLSYAVFEKDSLLASTIARYPKGKLIMAEPYDVENLSYLPVFDSSKEEIVPMWKDMVQRIGLKTNMNEAVERIVRGQDGMFDIRTNVSEYRAQRVVLATGLRGKPRTLKVPGENLPKVQALLEDPDHHRGQTVCVVGGGDSALEAAIALADAGAKVVLSYRGRSFSRAQPKNRQTIESYEAQRRIKVKYQSEVVEFAPDTVTLRMHDGTHKRYPNQAAFVLIGADPPVKWLASLGIHFVERPHMAASPKSDEMVRRFARDVQPCPDSIEGAMAVLRGEHVPVAGAEEQTRAVARPRKWLRSATAMLTGHGTKLDEPMPLSEFAKQARRHSGHGRRDQLDPRERTRVLRMLRDDGALRADEDSKLYLLDRKRDGSPAPVRHARPSTPPPRALPHNVATTPEAMAGDPLATIPPDARVKPVRPNDPRHDSPKPAVIVGLARAAQDAQRGGRRRKGPTSRPPIMEEPTRQVNVEARRMLEELDTQQEQSLTDHDVVFVDGDAHEEATQLFSVSQGNGRSPSASPPPRRPHEHSEATRQVDMSQMGIPGYRTAQEPAPPPASPTGQRGQDDPTRTVTLSEVDWDID